MYNKKAQRERGGLTTSPKQTKCENKVIEMGFLLGQHGLLPSIHVSFQMLQWALFKTLHRFASSKNGHFYTLTQKPITNAYLTPTEQCLNSAPKSYLCYGSWLRIFQLFTVLTGVIFKRLIMLSRTWIGLVGTSHLKEHLNLNILAMSDFRFL